MISRWNFCKIGWYCVSSRGSNPPKTTQKEAWIGIFKPNSQNIKTGILSKPLHRFQPNFAQWQRPTNALCGCPNTRKTNPRWRTATILKNRKLAISPQTFNRSAQNLARWSISSLNFKKCLYAILGHFDIFTYLEKWKSRLFEKAWAVVIFTK